VILFTYSQYNFFGTLREDCDFISLNSNCLRKHNNSLRKGCLIRTSLVRYMKRMKTIKLNLIFNPRVYCNHIIVCWWESQTGVNVIHCHVFLQICATPNQTALIMRSKQARMTRTISRILLMDQKLENRGGDVLHLQVNSCLNSNENFMLRNI
jgi:hypothetical protein